jgi:hypothetical protein
MAMVDQRLVGAALLLERLCVSGPRKHAVLEAVENDVDRELPLGEVKRVLVQLAQRRKLPRRARLTFAARPSFH